jgi:hypothetical protein
MKTQRIPTPKADPLLELEVPVADEDRTLPHDKWNEDLQVLVPNSSAILEGFTITLTINTVGYGNPHTVSAAEAGDLSVKYEFTIASSDFPSGNPLGHYELNYEVHDPINDLTIISQYRYVLFFDKEPPGGNTLPYLGFTADQLQGIYPGDIIDGHLHVNLSPWQKMAAGDTLTPWLASTPPDDNNQDSGLVNDASISIGADDVGRPVSVKFPQAALSALGDIPQFFGYQLNDKLGNTSAVSPARKIEVHLQGTTSVRPPKKTRATRFPRVVRRKQNPDLFQGRIEDLRPRDGRIKADRLIAPIDFIVPTPLLPIDGNVAQLSFDGVPVGLQVLVDPLLPEFILRIEPTDLPPISAARFDVLQVDYSYFDPFAGNENPSGKPVQLIIDRHAPGGTPPTPPAIAFTPAQLDGITEDELDQIADGLIVHISSWFDDDYDDQVELWLGTGPNAADGSYLTATPPAITDPSAGLEALFPRADLESVGTNPVFFGYRVTDWAGNISNLSETTAINVYLAGVPGDVDRPLIPEAAPYNPEDGSGAPPGTGLLIWTEANPETTVHIPTYLNVAVGDRIYVLWNGQTLAPVQVTQVDIDEEPTNGYLLHIEVPFPSIIAGTPGPNIPISYRISPASGTPAVTSPIQYINVNLETPGGPDPDPDPETPEHENMRPPVVLSDFPGSQNNLIPPEAYASAAKLTVSRAGLDNNVIWKVGDTLQVYWGTTPPDDPLPIPITAANETSNIIVPIPAAFIASKGTGEIPVYYELTRDLGNNNLVTARSPLQIVTVQAPGEAPGGTNPLAVADFPETVDPITGSPYRVLQRARGIDGTTFRIPLADAAGVALENVAAGDFISVDFYGVNDPLDGPGHDNDPSKPIIPESQITVVDYVILASDMTRGYYEISLPYSKSYYICRNLTVTKYSIRNAAGISKSAPDTLILFALNISGGTCTLP